MFARTNQYSARRGHVLYTTLVVSFALLSSGAFSQIASVLPNKALEVDTSYEAKIAHILRNEFSRIARTNTGGGLGNLVGISTQDNTLKFGYNFVFNKGMLELAANGGVKEGVANLISGDNLNTDVGIGVSYKGFFAAKIAIDHDKIESTRKRYQDVWNDYLQKQNTDGNIDPLIKDTLIKYKRWKELDIQRINLESLNVNWKPNMVKYTHDSLSLVYQTRIEKLELQKTLYEVKLEGSQGIIDQRIASLTTQERATKLDSVQYKIDRMEIESYEMALMDSLQIIEKELSEQKGRLKSLIFNPKMIQKVKSQIELASLALEKSRRKFNYYSNSWHEHDSEVASFSKLEKIAEEINDQRSISIRLHWFSAGLSLLNENFSIYNSTLAVDERITKVNDLTPGINASYTFYMNELDTKPNVNGARHIRYFSINGWARWGNNLSALRSIEIETRDSISAKEVIVSTQKVYSGSFKSAVTTANLSLDYYQFLGNKDNVGFHIRIGGDFGPYSPRAFSRVGLLFSALDREKKKSILNFELFYGLNDMFKSGGEEKIFERRVVGLQTTFPFDF